MSSKNRGKKSIDGDSYYTPYWCVKQCIDIVLPHVLPSPPGRILEPSAGKGAFVSPLKKLYPDSDLHAVDINKSVGPWEEADQSFHDNFLSWESSLGYELACGNPPFTLSFEFVKKCRSMCDVTVFLLRQGFLASEDRRGWLKKSNLSHVFQLAHRPSFTGDRHTDSADYAYICWTHGWEGPAEFHLLPTVPLEARKSSADGVLSYDREGKEVRLRNEKLF